MALRINNNVVSTVKFNDTPVMIMEHNGTSVWRKPFKVDISIGSKGTATLISGEASYGSTVVYLISSTGSYHLDRVYLNGKPVANSLTKATVTISNIKSDNTISATFKAAPPIS